MSIIACSGCCCNNIFLLISLTGFTEVDLLMAALLLAVEEHQLAAEHDAAEEQQRIARERMIMEQDMAYQESLAQDKEKVCAWTIIHLPCLSSSSWCTTVYLYASKRLKLWRSQAYDHCVHASQ